MEVTNSKAYTDLQAALAVARQKNIASSHPVTTAKISRTAQNITDVSVKSGKLVDRLYGNSTKKQEPAPIRIGSRFDAYA